VGVLKPAGVAFAGLWDISVLVLPGRRGVIKRLGSRAGLGWPTVDGESPVGETWAVSLEVVPSSTELVKFRVNLP
jgi:hypothetical protein